MYLEVAFKGEATLPFNMKEFLYILMVFIFKNAVINATSGDSTRELAMAPSFTTTRGYGRRIGLQDLV